MQAIITTGGKQYIVRKDDELNVELVGADKKVEFEVLMTMDGDKIQVGAPTVKDVKVKADVIGDAKGDKVKILKYKAKKRQKTLTGHRQRYARIKITSIG